MTEQLYIPMHGNSPMGIGTKDELEALIADGILPADTTLVRYEDSEFAV